MYICTVLYSTVDTLLPLPLLILYEGGKLAEGDEARNKGSKRCGNGAFHEANGNMPLSADNRSECHNDNVQSHFCRQSATSDN